MTISSPAQPTPEEIAQNTFDLAGSAYKSGQLMKAHDLYMLLLEHFPDMSILHFNLGLVFFAQTQFEDARNEFAKAIDLNPEDTDTRFNLALSQKETGDYAGAISSYNTILLTEPEHTDCLYNLGNCYRDCENDEQAIACYSKVLALDPSHISSEKNLAYLYHRAGKNDLAGDYYQQILTKQPENKSIQYLLAAVQGVLCDHAPDCYIREFFNGYAGHFEQSLVGNLGYDSPQQLFECLNRSKSAGASYVHGIDLGCGTGLAGQVFKPHVAMLDGVDLSGKMLVQAARKGCYTNIHQESILHHLSTTRETYDLFLATDVFIYVGDLLDIFTYALRVADCNALFCFSTERHATDDYCLLPTGRFAYSPDYIRRITRQTGWIEVAHDSSQLRIERGQWIDGDLWVFRAAPDSLNI